MHVSETENNKALFAQNAIRPRSGDRSRAVSDSNSCQHSAHPLELTVIMCNLENRTSLRGLCWYGGEGVYMAWAVRRTELSVVPN